VNSAVGRASPLADDLEKFAASLEAERGFLANVLGYQCTNSDVLHIRASLYSRLTSRVPFAL
jgi:hypothetical protein